MIRMAVGVACVFALLCGVTLLYVAAQTTDVGQALIALTIISVSTVYLTKTQVGKEVLKATKALLIIAGIAMIGAGAILATLFSISGLAEGIAHSITDKQFHWMMILPPTGILVLLSTICWWAWQWGERRSNSKEQG